MKVVARISQFQGELGVHCWIPGSRHTLPRPLISGEEVLCEVSAEGDEAMQEIRNQVETELKNKGIDPPSSFLDEISPR